MSKPLSKRKPTPGTKVVVSAQSVSSSDFDEVLRLIEAARTRAFAAVNQELVGLYWQIGEYISRKLESAAWGEGVVEQLADYIARSHPGLRGFTRPNLFRMRQFYETYKEHEKVSPLVRQLPWTHNLLILFYELARERAALPAPQDGKAAKRLSSKPTKRRKTPVPSPRRRKTKTKS